MLQRLPLMVGKVSEMTSYQFGLFYEFLKQCRLAPICSNKAQAWDGVLIEKEVMPGAGGSYFLRLMLQMRALLQVLDE